VSVAVNAGTIGKCKAQNGLSVYLACTGEAILLLVIRRDRCPINAVAVCRKLTERLRRRRVWGLHPNNPKDVGGGQDQRGDYGPGKSLAHPIIDSLRYLQRFLGRQ
jgi:hypothetical protein